MWMPTESEKNPLPKNHPHYLQSFRVPKFHDPSPPLFLDAINESPIKPAFKNSSFVSKEVISVFLDISKAFGKMWRKSLLYKLSQNGISANLLDLLSSFLSDRKQNVVLNGQTSE